MDIPHDFLWLETLSLCMLSNAVMASLAVLILIQSVNSRDRDIVKVLATKEPGSYKLFIPSVFCDGFV